MLFDGDEVGAKIYKNGDITLSPNRRKVKLKVYHCGDRPIQVGSHFHFFEVNKSLKFNREKAFGMHLDIPSGTAIRLEPGDENIVELVEFGGRKNLIGFNKLTMGSIEDTEVKKEAIRLATLQGYLFKKDGEEIDAV